MRLYLAGWLPVLPLQAAAGGLPEGAAAAWERQGPLELIVAANRAARQYGIMAGMAMAQARGRCPELGWWRRDRAAEARLTRELQQLAERISPRVQRVSADLVLLDLAGLGRLHGGHRQAAAKLERHLGAAGMRVRTGLGAAPGVALLAARSGLEEIAAGGERAALAPLPVTLLAEVGELTGMTPEAVNEVLERLERWGIRRLGELAELPAAGLAARLGRCGVRLQELARGETVGLLQPDEDGGERRRAGLEFDPPSADLEQLKAGLRRLLAEMTPELERHDRVVEKAELNLELAGGGRGQIARDFAVPTRDPRTLGAQLELELEKQAPRAAVERLGLECRLARPQRLQTRWFAAAPPRGAQIPKMLARLHDILATTRGRDGPSGAPTLGSPRLLDTHRPRAFTMTTFTPPASSDEENPTAAALPETAALALRVWRPPRRLLPQAAQILHRAGPWRTEGGWWRAADDEEHWVAEEWDAEVRFRRDGQRGLFRLGRDAEGGWWVVGEYD